jgi:hypothetical protein
LILKWTDPIVLKAGGGLALYALSSSRTVRMVGLGLIGWAAWEYFRPAQVPPKVIPYDPDAPLPLEQAATSSADPFAGTRWQGSGYTPSVRPARPGETVPRSPDAGAAKVIPFRRPTQEERAMFYGINPEPGDNVG